MPTTNQALYDTIDAMCESVSFFFVPIVPDGNAYSKTSKHKYTLPRWSMGASKIF